MPWSDDLSKVRRRRLYVDVAESLLKGIQGGTWPPGSRLPTDRQLSDQLHVSRPTVREALMVLEFGGLIEIRHGSGAYVVGNSAVADPSIASDSPKQLVEARMLLEPAIAELCAERLSEKQLDDLAMLVTLSERAVDSRETPELVRLGLQFHRALADGCGNEYLAGFCRTLVSVSDHPLWNLLHQQVLTTAERTHRELDEHRRIIDAIRRREPELARREMRDHLKGLWSIVLEGGDDARAVSGASGHR